MVESCNWMFAPQSTFKDCGDSQMTFTCPWAKAVHPFAIK